MARPGNWFQTGGSLGLEEPSYVVRQADTELYDRLRAGEFCYVLNSRQMGKSSLRVRAMERLRAEGWTCAAIDLTAIGGAGASSWEWFADFLYELEGDLKLEAHINFDDWLDARETVAPLRLLREFINDVVLEKVAGPIAIFIDEIDNVLRLGSFTDDLFAFIRWCYNQRAEQPKYERLTFALFGVATPGDLIQDKKITPFNIGTGIALAGFTEAEARVLAAGLQETAAEPEKALREILNWTGGQPFLTQRACQLVVESFATLPAGTEAKQIAGLLRERVVAGWEDRDEQRHFQTIRERLWREEAQVSALLGLYQGVLQAGDAGRSVTGSAEEMELRLTGLVVRQDGHLRVNNRLYREVFNAEWVAEELRKLRPYAEAFRAWEESGRKDASRLLGGKALEEALEWAQGKSLSQADREFLSASQRLVRERLQQAVNVLERAKKRAWLYVRLGAAVLVASLTGAGVLQYRASIDFQEARAVLDCLQTG
ncbi:MAG: AAA-like domain-containing protein [Cyanobacteria bacterium J06641_5]